MMFYNMFNNSFVLYNPRLVAIVGNQIRLHVVKLEVQSKIVGYIQLSEESRPDLNATKPLLLDSQRLLEEAGG